MNAIGYIRISVKDQSKYSLDAQENSINDYCTKNGLNLLNLFKDNGQSSDTFDRADFLALEAFIKKHKGQVRYLIVMDHDRFSRDLSEALMKIRTMEHKFGIKVLSVDEPLDLDIDDPNVFLNRAFKYLMANQELLSIRKRTRRGIRSALESGRFVNKAPYGYRNSRDCTGKGILIVDEAKACIVQHIFQQYLSGTSIFEIHREARRMGYSKQGNSVIQRLLMNCVYAGLVKVPAEGKQPVRYVKAIHKPIISETDFWQVQDLLNKRAGRQIRPSEEFPLRGILRCSCGEHMTAGWSKGKSKYYMYYLCGKHRGKNHSGTKLHDQLTEILHYLSLSDQQIQFLYQQIQQVLNAAVNTRAKLLKEKTKALKLIEDQIDSLERRLMRDEVEPGTYKKWYKKYQTERAEILAQIGKLNTDQSSVWDNLIPRIQALTNMGALYQRATLEQQHKLLRAVFDFGIVYSEGAYRTPRLNPAFSHNQLILTEKGLLFVEQSSLFRDVTPIRSP